MEDPEPLPHIPSNIIQATRLYMRTIDITVEFEAVLALPIQRQNNFYLMDWAVHCGAFGPAALKQINFCCLYLRAVTASDITNASGTAVRAEMWWGEHCEAPAPNGQINRREKPSSARTWLLWRKLLQKFANREKILTLPLGSWVVPAGELCCTWSLFYLPTTQELAEQLPDAYRVYSRTTGAMYRFDRMAEGLPADTFPVDATLTPSGRFRLVSILPVVRRRPAEVPELHTFDSHCRALPGWQAFLLRTVTLEVDITEVPRKLAQGIVTASDGAVTGIKASFRWVVAGTDGVVWATGSGAVAGFRPTSYRAEAYVVLATVCFLTQIALFAGAPAPERFRHYCDNQSVTQSCSKDQVVPGRLAPDWDVLLQLNA